MQVRGGEFRLQPQCLGILLFGFLCRGEPACSPGWGTRWIFTGVRDTLCGITIRGGTRRVRRRLPHQKRAQFIVEFWAARVQFQPVPHLLDGPGHIARGIQRLRQRAVRFGLRWSEPHRLASRACRAFRVTFHQECARQIHVRLEKIGS